MKNTVEVRLIAVIGAGAMGSGIAQVAATSGFTVNLSDVSATARGLPEAHGPRFSPPRFLLERVEKGHLGRKTGKGFYDHG